MALNQDIERELETARTLAESGRIYGMEYCFLSARRHAQRAGEDISEPEREDISEQITKIGNVGYGNGTQVNLDYARTFAKSDNKPGMENHISYAQRYAGIVGQDISEQVDGIRSLVQ